MSSKILWPNGPTAPIAVAPSILSADFGRLSHDVRDVVSAGADWVHVDVMDGHFVPNITIGPLVVKAVRAATQAPVDVHLMISNPDDFLEMFIDAGADVVTVHVEACTHLRRTLGRIRELGAAAGVALNPHTPEDSLRYVLDCLDLVLIMTVNPGFGGQAFLPEVLPKIRAVRGLIDEASRPTLLEVDGGVSPATAGHVAAAGARILVAGSAVFSHPPYEKAIHAIRSVARTAIAGGSPT